MKAETNFMKIWHRTKYNFIRIIYDKYLKKFCIESRTTLAKKYTQLSGFNSYNEAEEFINNYLKI